MNVIRGLRCVQFLMRNLTLRRMVEGRARYPMLLRYPPTCPRSFKRFLIHGRSLTIGRKFQRFLGRKRRLLRFLRPLGRRISPEIFIIRRVVTRGLLFVGK